ncbi:RidA family protein [Kineococcus sp. SYSU DK006]|uniref:RidA family protein n=1 Tax=Kineococcus sp. SYSU DK006 TaxID=3383127 RepID=UPI003D7C9F93
MTNEAITFIRPPTLTDQAPYAYAATASAKQAIYTAGACPLDADGQTVAVGDYVGQARQVMANLVVTLREAGAELTDVVKSTVYVASSQRDDLNAVWDVVHSTFGHHDAPSTLLGVSVLGWPNQLVEVEAIAVVAGPASTY